MNSTMATSRKRWARSRQRLTSCPAKPIYYFPPEDSQFEVANMPNAKFLPVPSIWGHFAGGPGTNPDDVKFIDNALKELLSV